MRVGLLLILLFVGITGGFGQNHIEPFHTRNLSPLIHFFGIPNNNAGEVLGKKQFVFGNYLNIANNATISRLPNETIHLDGEMYRNDILLRYGIGNRLQVEVSIPLVRHSSGMMDPFISGWHDTFGMPANGRELMSDYNLTYLYQENDNTYILMNEGKLDVGDIALRLSTPLIRTSRHLISLGSFIKFSTGDKNNLIGSGTQDVGFNFSGRIKSKSIDRGFNWFYSAGYMRIGSGAILDEFLSRNILFGSLGSAYRINSKWVPKIQFDFHSGFYKGSQTKQLGRESVQLVLGTDYFVSKRLNLSASFSEDIIINTAPDFVLQIGLSYQL